MQNKLLKITRVGLALVILSFGALPALAQDCWGWEDKGNRYWQAITPKLIHTCLDKGLNINAPDEHEQTPLHFGAAYGNLEVVMTLLNAGADVNARDKDRQVPLHRAAESNKNVAVVKALLDAGAEVDARLAISGWEHIISRTPLQQAAKYNENAEVTKILLQAGADVNLNDGINPNGIDIAGRTALHLAAKHNKNADVTRLLLNAGATVDIKDTATRQTPLHLAAKHNKNPQVIMLLLKAGADGKLKNANGVTAFQLASRNRKIKKSPAYQALKDAQF